VELDSHGWSRKPVNAPETSAIMSEVVIGLENCVASPPKVLNRAARFGLLLNQASVNKNFEYASDLLARRFPGKLAALFSPQHGLWGEQQANMIETGHSRDESLGVPIHSLYSEARKPTPAMLKGLDCFVVDLQDVGTRIYTFAWTIMACLEACSAASIPVVVLDRPNPLGGTVFEGPLLDLHYESFVGRSAIPMRHGLTIGELARRLNAKHQIRADLHVVPMTGWERRMLWPQTGRTWVLTSPNLPRWEGCLVYPGQVLLEGTNLSEGRGTTTPFEAFGAPFVSPLKLLEALKPFQLAGLHLRPIRFTPTFDKWQGKSCGGLYLHVTDPQAFRPVRTTAALLTAIHRLGPTDFAWRDPPYEYERKKKPIDILFGNCTLRDALDRGTIKGQVELDELLRLDCIGWRKEVADYLLYE
jgi:uncharacterized protein YbbC (DUF1343 family)